MSKRRRITNAEHRITFQRLTDTTDGAGGNTTVWADHATRWASAKAVKGDEGNESGMEQARQTWLFETLRDSKTEGIHSEDRIVFRSINYDIRTVRFGDAKGEDSRFLMTFVAETELGQKQ